MKNFEITCLLLWEKLAGQDASGGAQPLDIGQIDKSEGVDEDVNAVQQRRLFDRSNHRAANSTASASGQSTPRDKSGSDETKQRAGKKNVSFATGVVVRAILPGSAHQQMIARTLMKSEQSRPVMLTVICLVWIVAMTPPRPST